FGISGRVHVSSPVQSLGGRNPVPHAAVLDRLFLRRAFRSPSPSGVLGLCSIENTDESRALHEVWESGDREIVASLGVAWKVDTGYFAVSTNTRRQAQQGVLSSRDRLPQ